MIDKLTTKLRSNLIGRLDRDWQDSKLSVNWSATGGVEYLKLCNQAHQQLCDLVEKQQLRWVILSRFKSYGAILQELDPNWKKSFEGN